MTGFEPATPRPPDVYSNLTELHPDESMGVGVKVWVCISGANLINSDGSASQMIGRPLVLLFGEFSLAPF